MTIVYMTIKGRGEHALYAVNPHFFTLASHESSWMIPHTWYGN
jgi:hypothetical protein